MRHDSVISRSSTLEINFCAQVIQLVMTLFTLPRIVKTVSEKPKEKKESRFFLFVKRLYVLDILLELLKMYKSTHWTQSSMHRTQAISFEVLKLTLKLALYVADLKSFDFYYNMLVKDRGFV